MSEHCYRVVVTREDRNWLADVAELEGAHDICPQPADAGPGGPGGCRAGRWAAKAS
ncbi:MAG: hypothetical protein ACRDNZ_04395 [Streptosporangiaceae bacterium]